MSTAVAIENDTKIEKMFVEINSKSSIINKNIQESDLSRRCSTSDRQISCESELKMFQMSLFFDWILLLVSGILFFMVVAHI